MKIIHHILVPTDFSPCAANAYKFSLRLAAKWKSSIKLLHIVSPDNGVTDLPVIAEMATKEKIEVAVGLLRNFKDIGLQEAYDEVQVEDEVKAIQGRLTVDELCHR